MKFRGPAIGMAASAAMILMCTSAVRGHHSVAAGFDMDKSVTVTGTITEMEWINPHSKMLFEVDTGTGEVQSWVAWFTSANILFRRGWRAGDLPVGETVSVSGFPARDGTTQLYGGETKLSDGRTLFSGNAPGER